MWFVKTDFSRWRDEEDDEVTEDANLNPMSQMPGIITLIQSQD